MRAFLAISMTALLLAGCKHRHERLTATQADPRPNILQVGLVLDAPAADAVPMTFLHNQRGGRYTNEVLAVRIVPGLDETNLEREQRIGAFGLRLEPAVQFKGKARQQWADFTRTNTGKDIALIMDGKVFWKRKITSEASDGWLGLPGDWTFDEAKAFCDRLNAAASSSKQP